MRISSLGFLSDSRTAALVDRAGTIVWYCPGGFERPSAFASLLDPRAGHWRLGPEAAESVGRRCLDRGLVLCNEFETAEGAVSITDLLALHASADAHELGRSVPHALVRIVEEIRGACRCGWSSLPALSTG